MNSSDQTIATPRRRLLITGVPPQKVIDRAEASFDVTLWREPTPIGARLAGEAQGHDAVLVMPGDKLDAACIGALPRSVQVLATYSVGFDHIDLAAATARRLPVFNTPDVLTESVADLALFLILAAARDTTSAERTLREGRWGPWAPTSMLGRSLQDQRLGIFGMGRIGQAIARRALAFGMQLHYHNRSRLPAEREAGAVFHDTLEGMLAQSDVLCICAPSTPELRNAVDARRVACLPRGAMVVNVARGDLVDEPALFAAVHEGRVGAIGFDVYRNEPRIDPRWLDLPHATLLPHIGSATTEVRTAMGMTALDGVESHFAGRPAANLLNPETCH
ncbi:D-glycerate dehydrogenase [Variovorax humicola]|uniref:D-glycerate dehydrogenase n=1 Tax=Variovorax humicola TaxID=1769758 RepID=A0ABU8WAG1_9BURK